MLLLSSSQVKETVFELSHGGKVIGKCGIVIEPYLSLWEVFVSERQHFQK